MKRKPSKNLAGKPQPAWTPFETAGYPEGSPIKKLVESEPGYVGVFINSRYQVQMREQDSTLGKVLWLSIVRRDREVIRDWRELQRIKNELCGPEREAVEMYPAESRLVDTNNQQHLFVLPEGMSLPFGYAKREVSDESGLLPDSVHKQRPFEKMPSDLNALTEITATTPVWRGTISPGLVADRE